MNHPLAKKLVNFDFKVDFNTIRYDGKSYSIHMALELMLGTNEFGKLPLEVFTHYNNLKFQIVEGEGLRDVYTGARRGHFSLKSCMQGKEGCWFDIYVENPYKMLILHNDRVYGRVLLWEDKYLCLYGCSLAKKVLKDYLDKNGYTEFKTSDTIQLENWKFGNYPYLDKVRYLNVETGVLSSKPTDFYFDSEEGGFHYVDSYVAENDYYFNWEKMCEYD